MPKPNYQYEKRKRELEKKRKKELRAKKKRPAEEENPTLEKTDPPRQD